LVYRLVIHYWFRQSGMVENHFGYRSLALFSRLGGKVGIDHSRRFVVFSTDSLIIMVYTITTKDKNRLGMAKREEEKDLQYQCQRLVLPT